jgi:hypothetical protein
MEIVKLFLIYFSQIQAAGVRWAVKTWRVKAIEIDN